MLTDAQRRFIAAATRIMQIIVVALVFGVVSFLAVVLVIPAQPNPAGTTLSTVAIAAGAAAIVMATAAGTMTARKQLEALAAGKHRISPRVAQMSDADIGDVAPLVGIYQTQLIVRAAILEGAAFFALVAFMLERQSSSLSAAAALALFILFLIPTRSRVEGWVQNQLANLIQMRQLGAG